VAEDNILGSVPQRQQTIKQEIEKNQLSQHMKKIKISTADYFVDWIGLYDIV
jgi:hypothetical protein